MNSFNSISSNCINVNNTIIDPSKPVVMFKFENNMVNSGTRANISNITSSGITYVDTTKARGTYSISASNALNINFTLKNATFPITISFWIKPTKNNDTTCHGL